MAHAAIAYAKASRRRRMMACTSSIGPGATNMVTAAAVAHVNRLPVLLLPGDVFASRRPDPVLQQVEDFGDGTISANDCFRPVSRYFDRITRPEQIVPALTRAIAVLTDPAECGPVTLAFCQDVQAEAYRLSRELLRGARASARAGQGPDTHELQDAAAALARRQEAARHRRRRRALLRGREASSLAFCETHGIPVAETQAGKRRLPADHPLALGADRRHRHRRRQQAARRRPTSFSPSARASRTSPPARGRCSRIRARRVIGLNVQTFDAGKHRALPLVADARAGLGGARGRARRLAGARRLDATAARGQGATG